MISSTHPISRIGVPQDQISLGNVPGVSKWNKFGYREVTTAAAGEQTIWATTTNFSIMTSADTFVITYNSANDGLGTTGARSLLVSYLDADDELQTATHVLGSSGSDTTSFAGLGINRVTVVDSGSSDMNVSDILLADTAGVKGTQAVVPAGSSVTQQAIFHIPAQQTAIAEFLRIHCNKLSGSSPTVVFKGYVYSRITNTRYEVYRETLDTQSDTIINLEDPLGFDIDPEGVLYFVMDTDQNNTIASCRFSLNLYNT